MTIYNRIAKAIGEEKAEKLKENKFYKFCVDAVAMNVFSLSYALNEKFYAGMDWGEVGLARLIATVGNVITGRPYGIYRDYMMKKFGVTKKSHWLKKYAADVFIFATGQTPLYVLYLLPTGATGEEIRNAATFLTLVAPAAGRPQGITYTYCRHQFGLEDALDKSKEEKIKTEKEGVIKIDSKDISDTLN